MRRLLLASTAILALASATAVQAGPFWHLKKDLTHCAVVGYFVAQQTNCAINMVAKPHHGSNDYNTQDIIQDNAATLKYPQDFRQINVGGNLVVKGDGNDQSIDQSNEYTNNKHYGSDYGPTQLNVGVNVVEKGDDNTQSITQSNSITIGGGGGGYP